MKVIIVGCGRFGSGLSHNLLQKGHSVTVIDKNPAAFEKLDAGFTGTCIIGGAFDRDTLSEANIQFTDAVVACTNSDETNALTGRISRNIFKVPRVISRLYDPRKAELYRSLGIQTISTTSWGIHRATELLSFDQLDSVFTIGDCGVELFRIETPALLAGRAIDELTIVGETRVVSITRDNKTFLPTLGTALRQHDIIHIAATASAVTRLKCLMGLQ